MVQFLAATFDLVINTLVVKLERFMTSINGDRDWTNGSNGVLKVNFTSSWNIYKTSVISSNGSFGEPTLLVLQSDLRVESNF